jgi:glycerophosphoryl diester phosphodiesterase
VSTPLIIAHRGASSHAPENTLAAFRAAIDAGADGVEFDVQLTKDGVPVVFHDYDLRRIGSTGRKVCDLTAEEIARVDVGKWFESKSGNSDFVGESVPTLASVLDLLAGFHGRVYIELKADNKDTIGLVDAVCDAIRDSPLLPQMIVKSFRLSVIPEVGERLPEVKTAALFAPKVMDYLRRKKHIIALARELGADELSLHCSLASKKLCSLAADAGIPLTIWTAENTKWIERARDRGVHAIITNDPAKMLAARNS